MTDAPSCPPSEIEVGATDDGLRYWRAKEAVRQGEARLVAQALARTAMEARATAMTGWASASLAALAAAAFAAPDTVSRLAAGAAALAAFTAAALCITAMRPRDWALVGYDPSVIVDDPLPSELEILESIAGGLSKGIQDNNTRLKATGGLLRAAGWLLAGAPLLGAAIYLAGLLIAPSAASCRPCQWEQV